MMPIAACTNLWGRKQLIAAFMQWDILTCASPVVMGPHAPWLAQVQAQVAHIPWQTQVLVAVSNMAQLMSDIDLAIGAAGGTAWERCCLGLPTLMLVLAENQQAGAKALQSAGAAIALKEYWQIPVVLGELLSAKGANSRLTKMSSAAAAVTDGTGCVRASDQMMDSIRD